MKFIKVDLIPEVKEENIIYISDKYEIAVHLCACGCKNKVVTPIVEKEWSLTIDDNLVSLYPSISNRFECKSHYWIKEGNVIWC